MGWPRTFVTVVVSSQFLFGYTQAQPPEPPREFRAAWIATVANIDWPSKPGLSSERQQAELIALLDRAKSLNLNAVVLQVRPACDAMYDSPLEPWSEYLTGKMGQAPDTDYDPLEFAVREAHARGLELHAWFNPFRARHATSKGPVSANHVSLQHPDWVVEYGNYLWLDPGNSAASRHSIEVMVDVVRRYDVDAVHFDDYFYPYPINNESGEKIEFPDDASWAAYQEQTPEKERLSRDDWRRDNVNRLIRELYAEIKKAKPWVRLGISPFGIYRPGEPASIAGFDAYAGLYADSRLWLREGWVDYFSPQLYWPIEQKPQSFPVLLDWWRGENPHSRHIWPGLYTSKLRRSSDKPGWEAEEIIRQIELIREGSDSPGHIHFSMKALAGNWDELGSDLKDGLYEQPALVPAAPWCEPPNIVDATETAGPVGASISVAEGRLTFDVDPDSQPWLWAVQWEHEGEWKLVVVPGQQTTCRVTLGGTSQPEVFVRRVDRIGRLGTAHIARIEQSAETRNSEP